MATLISNENSYVRWDKTECHNYSVTNTIDYSAVDVTVTDKTSDWSTSFTLQVGDSYGLTVPGDGVYEICAIAQELLPENQEVPEVNNWTVSIVNIGALVADPDADEAKIDRVEMLSGGIIYHSSDFGGGDPPNNFGPGVPGSYASVITTIQNWLNANGGGSVQIVPPNTVSDPWVPVDPDDYQLVIISIAGDSVSSVITQQDAGVYPVFHFPDVDCLTFWADGSPTANWAISLLLNGEEVLQRPYDLSNPDDVVLFKADILAWMGLNGGGQLLDSGTTSLIAVFENCLQSAVLTLAELVPSVEECDYIYELCNTYACITRLVNKWLCQDPCPKTSCNEDEISYNEARRRAIELSTLFFHALMPLISYDRLWHLGNWDVSDERTCNTNNIIELFDKIKEYTTNCGFDCCDPCGGCDDCGDCTGCGQGNYKASSPNPCNCK